MSEDNSKSFEMRCGLMIAIFAAILAVNDLFAGKYGDDEIMSTNEKASAFMWYQSKSIKETIVEGQHDLLAALRSAGAIESSHVAGIDAHIENLNGQILRYGKEKTEILLGSTQVGPENWMQEVDGQKGKVIGAKEWETTANHLSQIGDRLDLGTLFLQLCLVMGAISLVLSNHRSKVAFFCLMMILGLIGASFTALGLLWT